MHGDTEKIKENNSISSIYLWNSISKFQFWLLKIWLTEFHRWMTFFNIINILSAANQNDKLGEKKQKTTKTSVYLVPVFHLIRFIELEKWWTFYLRLMNFFTQTQKNYTVKTTKELSSYHFWISSLLLLCVQCY